MIIASLSIFPTSEGVSVGRYVKKAVEAIGDKGIKHQTNAMSTVMEAEDIDELFDAVKAAYEAIKKEGVKRIYFTLTVDHRFDKDVTMESKLKSLLNP